MSYKVEKNIPAPVNATKNIYPFKSMEVGDSFLIKNVEERDRVRVSAIHHRARKDPKFSFTLRKTENGYRLWRTEFVAKPAGPITNKLKTA